MQLDEVNDKIQSFSQPDDRIKCIEQEISEIAVQIEELTNLNEQNNEILIAELQKISEKKSEIN